MPKFRDRLFGIWRRAGELIVRWVQVIPSVGIAITLILLLFIDGKSVDPELIKGIVTFALLTAIVSIAVILAVQRTDPPYEPKAKYHISLPCTKNQVRDYVDILYNIFPYDAPPKATLRAITRRELNPFGLILIRDHREVVVGGLEMYAMKEDFFEKYMDGEKSDPDITVGDIASLEDTINGRTLYVAITVDADLTHNEIEKIRFNLLAAAGFVLENVYFPKLAIQEVRVYGLAASKAGQTLMERLGFDMIRERGKRWRRRWWWLSRQEVLRLYRIDMDREALSNFRINHPIIPAELSLDVNRVLVDPREESAVHPAIEAVLVGRSLPGAPT